MPSGLKSIYRSLFPALKEMFFNRSLPGPVENPFRCLFSISFRYFVQFTRYTLRRGSALSQALFRERFANISPEFAVCQALFYKDFGFFFAV